MQPSPLLDYYTSIQNQGMVPKGSGFVRTKDTERADSLNLQSFYIRKEQATSIAAGLKTARFIKKLNLRNCGLTDESFKVMIQNVDLYSLKELDISYNPLLTQTSYEALAEAIRDERCALEKLNLEAN